MSQLLQKAAEEGNTARITQLLDRGDDIDWRDKGNGRTALVAATIADEREAVALLIERGADLDHQCTAAGYCALAWASELGFVDVADLLIKQGAKLDLPSRELRRTPLMAAAQSGHMEVVRLLLRYGARADLHDHALDNAWSLAAERGHERIARLLEDLGAGPPSPRREAAVLPWPAERPDVPSTSDPARVVHAYLRACHVWQSHAHALCEGPGDLPDALLHEADDIRLRYCTARNQDVRHLGADWPPDHTPDDLLLAIRPVASRAEVLVVNPPSHDGTRHEHLFVVKQSGGEWRIDSVKRRQRGDADWEPGAL